MEDTNTKRLEAAFTRLSSRLLECIDAELAPADGEVIQAEATAVFMRLLGDMPYREQPGHIMANAMFFCTGVLAFHQPLTSRGFDAHGLGRAALNMTRANVAGADPASDPSSTPAAIELQRRDGLESMKNASPGEFVFEVVDGGEDFDYGMNVKSCAICHLFSKHQAMDLVPYMCASDDVVSDAFHQGLARTGTIALGAGHCDFRFSKESEGRPLQPHYPERIRLVDTHAD